MERKYKHKLTYDETKIIIMSLVELKNRLIEETVSSTVKMLYLKTS